MFCGFPSPNFISVTENNKKHVACLHTSSLWCNIKGKEVTDKQANKMNTY
jgi:hypothetical protein